MMLQEVQEEEWVGNALREAERKKCISKVLSIEVKDAVPSGNNFTSETYRLKIKIHTNSGDVEERFAIYKRIPVNENEKMPWINKRELFKIEARMYQETFTAMGRLLKSKDPAGEALWPEFYGVKGNCEVILMEDLTACGYETIDRLKGLDFHHASVVLKNLAKFHALGAVILEKGIAIERDFPSNKFIPYDNASKEITSYIFTLLATVIKEDWPNEWHTYADGLNTLIDKIMCEITMINEKKEYLFKTINHGDCWMNNILFKYEYSGTQLDTIRFIDYQQPFVHNPCYDIHYLFSTSLRLEYFDKRLELLKLYHESLEKYLKLFGYSKKAPTYEELQKYYETTRVIGLLVTLRYRPYMRNESFYELHKKYGGPDDKRRWLLPFRYGGEEHDIIMRTTLQQLRELGFL